MRARESPGLAGFDLCLGDVVETLQARARLRDAPATSRWPSGVQRTGRRPPAGRDIELCRDFRFKPGDMAGAVSACSPPRSAGEPLPVRTLRSMAVASVDRTAAAPSFRATAARSHAPAEPSLAISPPRRRPPRPRVSPRRDDFRCRPAGSHKCACYSVRASKRHGFDRPGATCEECCDRPSQFTRLRVEAQPAL